MLSTYRNAILVCRHYGVAGHNPKIAGPRVHHLKLTRYPADFSLWFVSQFEIGRG